MTVLLLTWVNLNTFFVGLQLLKDVFENIKFVGGQWNELMQTAIAFHSLSHFTLTATQLNLLFLEILNYSKKIRYWYSLFATSTYFFFQREKNIGKFLVRSSFQTSDQPESFECACSRHKSNVEKKSELKRSMKITDHFACTSANDIYCIPCTYCKKLYIRGTGRRLGDRFREHLRDVEKNDKDASQPVSRHFNLRNHSKQHMAVCGLSLRLGSSESRTLESTEPQRLYSKGGLLRSLDFLIKSLWLSGGAWSQESKGLRFDSSWEFFSQFSLCPTLVTIKNIYIFVRVYVCYNKQCLKNFVVLLYKTHAELQSDNLFE